LRLTGIINKTINMKTRFFQTLAVAALTAFTSLTVCFAQTPAATSTMPKVGDTAPLVEGKNQDGKTWKLADQIGKKVVVLYFYPKDETPGCTKEACSFRDNISLLQKDDVEVVGVSFDSAESHQKFISTHNLNFPLLADTDGKIADAYGVRMPDKSMARRVSFLIGKDGKIAHVTDSGNAETHVSEMKAAAAALKKS
jgi:peroxiredoxin Q/BCP